MSVEEEIKVWIYFWGAFGIIFSILWILYIIKTDKKK